MAACIWPSGPVTRRDTSSIIPPASDSAAASTANSMPSARVALARCADAYSFATSSAASATARLVASFCTVSRDHWSTVMPGGSPAISFFSVFARKST